MVAGTALALVLLASAGVLMKALITMRSTQTPDSTHARNMVAAEIRLPPVRFARLSDRVQLFR